jgi:hypothetical protein
VLGAAEDDELEVGKELEKPCMDEEYVLGAATLVLLELEVNAVRIVLEVLLDV